jgi:hypothetical protein
MVTGGAGKITWKQHTCDFLTQAVVQFLPEGSAAG